MQINSTCPGCKIRFNASLSQIVVCDQCEHYWHKECIDKNIGYKCKIDSCDFVVCSYKSKKDFTHNSQHAINLLSLERTHYRPSCYDIFIALFYRIPLISYYLFWFMFKKRSYYALQKLLSNVCNILNINIKLDGAEHINEKTVIYVSNHVAFLDALIIPQIVVTGAVASVSNKNNPVGKLLSECSHVYFVTRGKSNNNVEKIQTHIENNGSLLFTPQGLFAHHMTLPLFRRGAFATKFDVQPILLLYRQNIGSLSIFNTLCYPKIDLVVKILPEMKKRSEESVNDFSDRVRHLMAENGGLLLSNVSSRDIND